MERRACTNCKIIKPLVDYSRDKYRPSGRKGSCKRCESAKRQDNRDAHIAANRTPLGRARIILNGHIRVARDKLEPVPTHSFEKFGAWLLNETNYLSLHNTWAKGGYTRDLSPSVVRINEHDGFTIDNLKVTSNGVHLRSLKRKGLVSVQGTPVNGTGLVLTFPSAVSAGEAMRRRGLTTVKRPSHNILRASKSNSCSSCYGYTWVRT